MKNHITMTKRLLLRRFIKPAARIPYDQISRLYRARTNSVLKLSSVSNVYHCCVPKTASVWVKKLLSDPVVYRYSGLQPFDYQRYLQYGAHRGPLTEREFSRFAFPLGTIITQIFTDYNGYSTIQKPDNFRSFFVMRDPRDLVVSWYFSMKDTHPEMTPGIAEWRRALLRQSKDDGLCYAIQEMEGHGIFEAERSWFTAAQNDDAVEIKRFEDLFGDNQFAEFRALMQHLCIPIPDAELRQLLKKYAFSKQQASSAHYRKGRPGDWENHLDEHHLTLLAEKTGNIVSLLQYDEVGGPSS